MAAAQTAVVNLRVDRTKTTTKTHQAATRLLRLPFLPKSLLSIMRWGTDLGAKGLLDRLYKCDKCVERSHICQGPFKCQVKAIIRDATESREKSARLKDETACIPDLGFGECQHRAIDK